MSQPKRRLFELAAVTPTFIGAESVIVGNIRGTGQFVVLGEVHGDGEIEVTSGAPVIQFEEKRQGK